MTYKFEIRTENDEFFAEIFIEETGHVVRETKEVKTKEQATQDAQAWIEKKSNPKGAK